MQSCCIIGCESYKDITSKKISYFKFPSDDELFAKWVAVIKEPPNWNPNINSQICETHFKPEDIERPLNIYPYLKSHAVPSIFPTPKHTFLKAPIIKQPIKQPQQQNLMNSSIKSPIVEQPPNLDNTSSNEDVTISSPVLPSTPAIISSNIVNHFPKIHQTLMSSNPQRFRRILPKTAQHTDTNVHNLNKHKGTLTNALAGSNPYIIIIPTFNNSKSLVSPCSMQKVPQKSTKKPILKITVSRKVRQTEELLTKNKDKIDANESLDIKKTDEFVVNNYKLNKSVVFSFDPISDDIRVSHRPIVDDIYNANSENTDNKHSKRITRSSNKDNQTTPELTSQVNNNYLKTQQYDDEMNNKLLMLGKVPKYDTEEIEKLEKELLKYGNSVNSSIDRINGTNRTQVKKRTSSNLGDNNENQENKSKVFILEQLLNNKVFINNEPCVRMKEKLSIRNRQIFIYKKILNSQSESNLLSNTQNIGTNNGLKINSQQIKQFD